MTRTVVVLAYIAVLDAKIVKFLKRQRGLSHILWVLDPQLVRECCSELLGCEVLDPNDVALAVRSWSLFGDVKAVDRRMFRFLHQPRACIIMPDDPVSHAIADRYFGGYKVVFMPSE